MKLFTILLALVNRISTGENWIQIGPFLIQFGVVYIDTPVLRAPNDKYGMTTVTFTKTFSQPPTVIPGCDIFGGYESSLGVSTKTTSTVNLSILHNSPVNFAYINWIAIGRA